MLQVESLAVHMGSLVSRSSTSRRATASSQPQAVATAVADAVATTAQLQHQAGFLASSGPAAAAAVGVGMKPGAASWETQLLGGGASALSGVEVVRLLLIGLLVSLSGWWLAVGGWWS